MIGRGDRGIERRKEGGRWRLEADSRSEGELVLWRGRKGSARRNAGLPVSREMVSGGGRGRLDLVMRWTGRLEVGGERWPLVALVRTRRRRCGEAGEQPNREWNATGCGKERDCV